MAHGGDPAALTKLIRALEKAGDLDARVARAVEKGAAARQDFFEAAAELRASLLGKAFTFPGPFTDPDVFRNLVRVAKTGMGVTFQRIDELISHVRLERLKAQLPEMTSEEMVKVREAWEQATTVKASAQAPIEIQKGSKLLGRFSNGSRLEIILRKKEDPLFGGEVIALDPHKTTTITGTIKDTNVVAERGFLAPSVTLVGDNPGGINLLRFPRWGEIQERHIHMLDSDPIQYWRTVCDEFWETVNKPWLDEAIRRGDAFRFVSDPSSAEETYVTVKGVFVLDNGQRIRSIFGREVDYLKAQGYEFRANGTAVRTR